MTKRLIAVTLFALATGTGSMASTQQPAAQPQAPVVAEDQQPTDSQLNRLFDAMRIRQQMASMTQTMSQVMQQQMEAQIKQMQEEHPESAKMTPEQQKAFNAAMGKFMQKAMALYTADDMMADMKGIYKKHLSQSDVENTITFFGSSSGQRILDMAPVMMQEYMPMVMRKTEERLKPVLNELQLELAQIMAAPPAAVSAPKQ